MHMDSPVPIKAFRRSEASDALSSSAPATGTDVDDGALMVRYAQGDVRAFEVLYTRHKGSLYRYLQRMCRNREACNDLFQEVWSKVITTRERYEARAQFSTFLFRVAHNCAVDYFRRAARHHAGRTEDVDELEEFLPGQDSERPDAKVSEAQLKDSFKAALDKLPAEQRNVFVLYEETGMTLEEIGQVTGVGFETAKSRLRYALSKLRHALRQYDPRGGAVGGTP
jgi:RNA polymerase sigma-70 factor, ECF subfamily